MVLVKRAEQNGAPSTRQPIVRTRADAVRNAIASTVMEGGTVTDDTEQLLAEWADGKLDDDQLMDRILSDLGPLV